MDKQEISNVIKATMKEKEVTVRSLAEQIGMKHPQVIRVTGANNYNIDTLMKILDGLDLEIEIKKKGE